MRENPPVTGILAVVGVGGSRSKLVGTAVTRTGDCDGNVVGRHVGVCVGDGVGTWVGATRRIVGWEVLLDGNGAEVAIIVELYRVGAIVGSV